MLVFAVVLVLLCVLVVFLVLPGRHRGVAPQVQAQLAGRNVAHRGLHSADKARPENSLPAFEAAAASGYGIELDLQLTKDGEVVVFHDDDVKRMCGPQRRVDSYTLEELRPLRLAGTGQGIPLFSEVLALVAGRVPLIVELKMGPRNALLCEKACALLREYDGPYCVESFDPRIVAWFRKNAPEILRGQLSARPGNLNSGAAGLAVGWLLTNVLARPHFIAYSIGSMAPTVRLARAFALRVAWTARPGDDIKKIQADNAAVIFEFYTPPAVYRGKKAE